MQRKAVTLYDQTRQPQANQAGHARMERIPLQAGRGILVRVDRAMKAFFKRVGKGENPAIPATGPSIVTRRWRCWR